ncbi:uncharacterized protein LOC120524957 isoform X1 [Polypterus senegalus]|uniref:uncharacterized protein LOC120524957 isoform X1 n=1 Tax=Polypterus senegalus TaxID=55291 RepID=UPI001963E5AC|nr:uncharacterized protein LOC120524957 isoform X1 [Polypterus senegalus]
MANWTREDAQSASGTSTGMDASQHSTFLIVILVLMLLFLAGVALLLLNHCRQKCLKKRHKEAPSSMKVFLKDQTTSTSNLRAVLSMLGVQSGVQNRDSQTSPIGAAGRRAQRESFDGSNEATCTSSTLTSRNQHFESIHAKQEELGPSQELLVDGDCEQSSSVFFWKQENEQSLMSGIRRIVGSTLTPESILAGQQQLKASTLAHLKRLSSSMKSDASPEELPVPVESPVVGVSQCQNQRTSSLPRDLSYYAAGGSRVQLISYEAPDSPYNNQKSSLGGLEEHGQRNFAKPYLVPAFGFPESSSVPSTLSRPRPCAGRVEEGGQTLSEQSLLERAKASCFFQPRAWFISWSNAPKVEFLQQQEHVGSRDSGVDIFESRHQRQGEIPATGQDGNPSGIHTRPVELEISPREAVEKLGTVESGSKRSLWQKREDRPLIVIN